MAYRKAIPVLLEELRGVTPEQLESDEGARRHTLKLIRALSSQIQAPEEMATNVLMSPLVAATVRVAADLDLFTILTSRSYAASVTALAAETGAEAALLHRVLRALAAADLVGEKSEGRYEATPATRALASPGSCAAHRFAWDVLIAAAVQAPRYFREKGHALGTDPHSGLVQYALDATGPLYELLAIKPRSLRDYAAFTATSRRTGLAWSDWYPVEEDLLHGYRSGTPLLVDVGGGMGNDLLAFHRDFPNEDGPLILQEQASVIDHLQRKRPKHPFQCIVHDFFKEQPIKGARVYFLHHILHNWPDDECLVILRHLKTAMRSEYSKVLINDLVLPDAGASEFQTRWDLTMMTLNWGMERSKKQWQTLVDKAGMEVVRIMSPDSRSDGIIEVMLK